MLAPTSIRNNVRKRGATDTVPQFALNNNGRRVDDEKEEEELKQPGFRNMSQRLDWISDGRLLESSSLFWSDC
jgi:hypothetical protein